jgi:hypothetical protein
MSRSALVLVAVALLSAALALLHAGEPAPELEVRAIPHQTQFGRIFPGFAAGQVFRCAGPLRRIDVALVPLGGEPTPLEFTLRADGPEGEVLRSARLSPRDLPSSDAWVSIAFEPVEHASGQYHFSLASSQPSSHSPWVRYRAVSHVVRPWGTQVLGAGVREFELALLPHGDLRALALAVDGLDAAAAPATAELFDPRSGELVARAEVLQRSPQASAWVFFTFATPWPGARWRPWTVRLQLPPDARVIGDAAGPSLISFHAGEALDGQLAGATVASNLLPDRDLVFRAWGDLTHEGVRGRALARLGWRAPWIALLFLLAAAALGRTFAVARNSA